MLTGTEVAAAMASIKNLRDFVTSLKDSADKRKLSAAVEDVQAKFIILQSQVMEAQASLSSANERARTAEQKCVDQESFGHEAERYALHELTSGFYVYALKPGMEQGEPPHYLCANCFAKHQKSIIQRTDMVEGYLYICHNCGSKTMKR